MGMHDWRIGRAGWDQRGEIGVEVKKQISNSHLTLGLYGLWLSGPAYSKVMHGLKRSSEVTAFPFFVPVWCRAPAEGPGWGPETLISLGCDSSTYPQAHRHTELVLQVFVAWSWSTDLPLCWRTIREQPVKQTVSQSAAACFPIT